jgi:hypothetical protein
MGSCDRYHVQAKTRFGSRTWWSYIHGTNDIAIATELFNDCCRSLPGHEYRIYDTELGTVATWGYNRGRDMVNWRQEGF